MTTYFTISEKAEIFHNQYNKNYEKLYSIHIASFFRHIDKVKSIPNHNNLPICPFCLRCYVYPGEITSNEIRRKYNILIDNPKDLYSNDYIRPGEFDKINPNKDGILICSLCSKLKTTLNIQDFFFKYFTYRNDSYCIKDEYLPQKIELMDIDFNNTCFNCSKSSTYKICDTCASDKDNTYCVAC